MPTVSRRIAMGVEYDGTAFAGWQWQHGEPTVQAAVEAALASVADHPVRVMCAGRTDTGVHARCQVLHFDTQADRPMHGWVLGGNSQLPGGVSLLWAKEVPGDFHARFSATGRRYRYRVLNRWTRPALERHRAAWWHYPLDVERMRAGARHLIGEHDFTSFRSAGCQARHPVREVRSLPVSREGMVVTIDVEANAFLQHMVRNIAGTLMTVGQGDREPEWVGEVLAARDRTVAGVTAPPEGLTFVGVDYPPELGLPAGPGPDFPDSRRGRRSHG